MKNLIPIALTVIFLLALLSFTVSYSVRFTEAAVVTTFGKAGETPVREAGLRFKWPYPIQTVTKYDTRTRLLQNRAEAQQTADDRQIIVESFLTWRVSEPLEFFKRFSNSGSRPEDHFESAERTLRSLLAGAMAETGRYSLSELFTPEANSSKLPELEARILAALQAPDERGMSLSSYGIEPTGVGIHRVRLAEETTRAVNERITANRERLAKELESAGDAEAQAITAKAESDRQRILDFAARRAAEIRAQGDIAASQYVERMNSHPDLAVFLKNLDFVRSAFSSRTTVILSTDVPGLNLIDPEALGRLAPGEIPGAGMPESWRTAGEGQAEGSR